MIKSIQHFEEISINIFERLENNLFRNPKDFASYAYGLTDELHNLGLRIMQETLETMNQMICDSAKRQQKWTVEKHSTEAFAVLVIKHFSSRLPLTVGCLQMFCSTIFYIAFTNNSIPPS